MTGTVKKVRLDARQEQTLLWFVGDNGRGESRAAFQWNTWSVPGDHWRELPGLKRRGLLDAEGRGDNRQWWITDAGIEALRAKGHKIGESS